MAVCAAESAHSATAGSGRSVVAEPSDQLAGQVLRLGGAAAVPAGDQVGAGVVAAGQLGTPGADGGGVRAGLAGGLGERGEVLGDAEVRRRRRARYGRDGGLTEVSSDMVDL